MDIQRMDKEINEWQYSAILDLKSNKLTLNINPDVSIPIPDKLSKYYQITDYNTDALINSYLYTSHPFELNDPFDCFSKLISFNNIPLEMCVRFLHGLFGMEEEKVRDTYISDPKKLFDLIQHLFYDYTYSKIGIVSMSSESADMQMWAYYSGHKGFQILFKTENLKKILHGPFPVNYVSETKSIDFSENVFIASLFQTNIKSKSWVRENEWRFLFESNSNMRLPNKKEDWDKMQERKCKYSKSDIEEIVLGFLFFNPDYMIGEPSIDIGSFDFTKLESNDNLIRILDFLIENSDIKVSLIYMQNDLEFKLTKKRISLTKISENVYSYKRLE